MRPTNVAAFTLTILAAACGGEQPAPQPPPTAPPPPATASAAPAPAPADTSPPPPPKPSLAELIPAALKGLGEAFNAHDAKKIASYYADDCVFQTYGAGEAHGKDDVVRQIQTIFDVVGDFKSAAVRVFLKGNIAVEDVVWSGTMAGDFMGLKASKHPIGAPRAIVLVFNEDGLVKEQHEYGDGAGVMMQMKGARGAPPVPTIPTNAPETHLGKGTADEDKLADWAKAMDETFSKDDPKLAAATSADDGDYWVNISGKPATHGKKDLTKELTAYFKAFPDQKWTTGNVWGIDGFAVIEHTMTGTQKGPLGPVPASNKTVSNWHWLDIMEPNADQKVQHGWGFANLVEALSQTGAIKPPAEKAPTAGKGEATKSEAPKAPPAKTDAAKDKDKK